MPCWRFQALYKIRQPFTILPFIGLSFINTFAQCLWRYRISWTLQIILQTCNTTTIIGIKLQLFRVFVSVCSWLSWLSSCEWKRSSGNITVSSSLLSQKSLNEDVNIRMRRQKLSVQMTMYRFCSVSCRRIQFRSLCPYTRRKVTSVVY